MDVVIQWRRGSEEIRYGTPVSLRRPSEASVKAVNRLYPFTACGVLARHWLASEL